MAIKRSGIFDNFASYVSRIASKAPFFAFCVFLVFAWIIEGIVKIVATGDLSTFLDDRYQLQVNSLTTIITFLLAALLQNGQARTEDALHFKLDAIAEALRDLMDSIAEKDPSIISDIKELEKAIGIEEEAGTKES